MANGRYDDRLKVYKNGTWYNAKRVRVYKNGWIDLGDDQSDNTKSLYVYKDNSRVRVTRNKSVTPREVTTSAGYQQRETAINTVQQYCFTNTGGAVNRRFHVIMYVKANAATRLFEFWTGNQFSFYAGIKMDGTVYYQLKDTKYAHINDFNSGVTHDATTKISMGFNQDWQKIEFIGEIGASGDNAFNVYVNNNRTGFRLRTAWDARSWGGSNGKLGSGSLRISRNHSFEINTADAPFTSLADETTTTTVYDTTWV